MNVAAASSVTRFVLFCFMAVMALPVRAADDAYLKALEAEASNLHKATTQDAAAPAASTEAKKDSVATPAAPTDLRKAEFETALKEQLPNTFTIYTRLTPEQKSMVVETYFANDRKIATASKQVFDFYLFDRKRAN